MSRLAALSRQQWLLRALVLLAPACAFAVEVRAGAAVQLWVVVLLTGFTVLSAAMPDSHAPLAVPLLVAGYWAMEVGEQISVSLLAVTVAMVGFHVACLLAAYGPPSVALDSVLLRRWTARAGLGCAAAGGVWLAARVADGRDVPGNGWLMAAALLLVVGWAALLGRKLSVHAG